LTAAGAFKYIPRTTTFTADVTYPIANLTATSTGLTIGNTTNDKNITITQDVTGGAGIELYGANVNINSNLKTTNSGAMYLKGNATIAAEKYIESNGAFTHDGNLTFKSTATGTAAFGPLGGTFTTVSGKATIERYIPAKRAYRFLSPSVTTTTSIKENWQENGGSTAGLGTHITGTGGATNGFDATATNNPSLYSFNNSTGAWAAVTSTLTNLTAGTPYRLMVRGDRTVSLTINNPTATPTVLRATGTLKTGNYTPTLNPTANGYSFVGNPYQAPIDIKAVLTASTNMNSDVVYYWDPTLNSRGTYVTRTLGIVNQNSVTSSFNQYLQPGQAVFVKKDNTANVPIMTITENDKSIVSAAAGVFRNASSNEIGVLRANLKASVNNEWTTIEGALALFHSNYTWGATQEDATKLFNLDEEVSFVQNNTSLAIAMQSNPALTDELPIKLNTTRYTNYQWQFDLTNYDGLTPYLFDAQNNTFTQIENNTIVPFTVNGQEQTRFKIVFQNGILNTPDFSNQMVLYPNPGKADSSFYLTGINNAKVSLYNLLGQNLPVETTVDGATTKVKPSVGLSQGVYVVIITQEGKTAQVKWIVE
ncbi:MAG: T9SS type A sorting domain-containing protein, partial [Flavobacterium sp.]|uniref:T9SS type A sorting domain-containing protein n=1 Tax=Flavobacterium sp. TaxID=239 RepID=UPI003BDADCA1